MCAIPLSGRRACATAINLVENQMNRLIICSSNAGRGGVDASADWTGKFSDEKLSAMDFEEERFQRLQGTNHNRRDEECPHHVDRDSLLSNQRLTPPGTRRLDAKNHTHTETEAGG